VIDSDKPQIGKARVKVGRGSGIIH